MNYMYPYQQYQYQQPQQIQNTGLVSVRGVNEARNYPVAPGNSVTFKDETAPYIYTKTMGFSQLDRPTFEIFRLVKETGIEEQEVKPVAQDYRSEIDMIKSEIEKIKEELRHGKYSIIDADSESDEE